MGFGVRRQHTPPVSGGLPSLEPRSYGPIVYRLGHDPFKVERRVRLPLGLCNTLGMVVRLHDGRRSMFGARGVGAVAQLG